MVCFINPGSAEPGDRVDLRRNHSNEYDANAIAIVENTNLQRIIGHLPKELVSGLATMIDNERLALLSGIMPDGSGDGSFNEEDAVVNSSTAVNKNEHVTTIGYPSLLVSAVFHSNYP